MLMEVCMTLKKHKKRKKKSIFQKLTIGMALLMALITMAGIACQLLPSLMN